MTTQEIPIRLVDLQAYHQPSEREFAKLERELEPAWGAILLHASLTLLLGALAGYAAYTFWFYPIRISALFGLLVMIGGSGLVGAICCWLTGSAVTGRNLAFGCGVTAIALFFLAFCTALGGLAAVLVSASGLSLKGF